MPVDKRGGTVIDLVAQGGDSLQRALVAQWIEHWPPESGVARSNRAERAILFCGIPGGGKEACTGTSEASFAERAPMKLFPHYEY